MIQPTHNDHETNEHEEQFNKHHHHRTPRPDAYDKHMKISDATAIMVGSFVAIAVLGFAGLVMWRQILE